MGGPGPFPGTTKDANAALIAGISGVIFAGGIIILTLGIHSGGWLKYPFETIVYLLISIVSGITFHKSWNYQDPYGIGYKKPVIPPVNIITTTFEDFPYYLTSDVMGVARGIIEDKQFERMPILADALMDAGFEEGAALLHLRNEWRSVIKIKDSWFLEKLANEMSLHQTAH